MLVTYSNASRIVEVAPSGEVMQWFDNGLDPSEDDPRVYAFFGYATFRTSLYGPPPR